MQLRDLPIDKRIKAINVKSCLAYEDYLESLKSCDFDTLKKGVKALLEIEPEFFLIDEEFLDSVIEIISIYNYGNIGNITALIVDCRCHYFKYF